MKHQTISFSKTETGFALQGVIRFQNVLSVRRDGVSYLTQSALTQLDVDLSGLNSSDISALSLFLRWQSTAKQLGKKIRYLSVPLSLQKLAAACGIRSLIGE